MPQSSAFCDDETPGVVDMPQHMLHPGLKQRMARRTISGTFAPLSCAAGAGVLMGSGWYLSVFGPATPGQINPLSLVLFAFVCLIGAIALEVQIRRQLALARNGEPANAIIDEVIDTRWSSDGGIIAEYHFFTPTGQWIDGTCHIDSTDALTIVRGARHEVMYDPTNPTRNQLLVRLWGVEYEDDAS